MLAIFCVSAHLCTWILHLLVQVRVTIIITLTLYLSPFSLFLFFFVVFFFSDRTNCRFNFKLFFRFFFVNSVELISMVVGLYDFCFSISCMFTVTCNQSNILNWSPNRYYWIFKSLHSNIWIDLDHSWWIRKHHSTITLNWRESIEQLEKKNNSELRAKKKRINKIKRYTK